MADSNITKRALASALKELMESTPFSKITVSDICAKCNMNRKSFYYHFKDKFDLVNWIFDVEYLSHVQLGVDLIGWDSVLHLCDYFYENKDFYRKVMAEDIKEILGDQTNTDFYVNFWNDAIICAFGRWISERNPVPPKEFVKLLKSCIKVIIKTQERLDA